MVLKIGGIGEIGLFGRYRGEDEAIVFKDFSDFLMGYKHGILYPGTFNTTKILAQHDIREYETLAVEVAQSAEYTKVIDEDFDWTIAFPRVIKGVAYANVNLDVEASTVSIYAKVIIKHYDGSTETTLATMQTGAANDTVGKNKICTGTVSEAIFSKGDILRVTLEGWAKNDSATAYDSYIKLKGTGISTNVYIPFVITK